MWGSCFAVGGTRAVWVAQDFYCFSKLQKSSRGSVGRCLLVVLFIGGAKACFECGGGEKGMWARKGMWVGISYCGPV